MTAITNCSTATPYSYISHPPCAAARGTCSVENRSCAPAPTFSCHTIRNLTPVSDTFTGRSAASNSRGPSTVEMLSQLSPLLRETADFNTPGDPAT